MNAIDKYLTKLSPHGDKLMIDYLLSMPSPTYRKTLHFYRIIIAFQRFFSEKVTKKTR